MKRFLKQITLFAAILALGASFSACNILTIYRDGTGGAQGNGAFDENVTTTASYGKRYDVESVNLKLQNKSSDTSDAVTATAKVQEAAVSIRAGVTGGTQLGSGTIIDIDVTYEDKSVNDDDFVYVLTCHHVIEGSSNIAVYIPKRAVVNDAGGSYDYYEYYEYGFAATLMGSDKESDLAVLRIEISGHDGFSAEDVVKAPLCNEDTDTGEAIFTIGNPLGENPGTASYGYISNELRKVNVENIGKMKLTQANIASNSGNSGGGIFNYAGQLIGVLNSGVSLVDDNGDNIPDEAGSNLTYFIPAFGENGIANVAYSLISTVTEDNYGYVTGRWMLGATLAESSLGPFTSTKYIYVVEISNNETYSLHTCGVATSDYIFSMTFEKNGEEYKCNMNSISEFSAFIAEMKETVAVGDTATVEFGQNPKGSYRTGTMTLRQYIYSI